MKSIRTKFAVLMLVCILASCLATMAAGTIGARQTLRENSTLTLNLLCQEKADELDDILSGIEARASGMADYFRQELEEAAGVSTLSAHLARMAENAMAMAEETPGVMSAYVRLEAETEGRSIELTHGDTEGSAWDAIYESTRALAGWQPVRESQETGTWTATYIAPIYVGSSLVGMLGMDLDWAVIQAAAEDISVYKNGFAFLLSSDGGVIYHPRMSFGTEPDAAGDDITSIEKALGQSDSGKSLITYKAEGQRRAMVFRTLRNGMVLAVTVPTKEINTEGNWILIRSAAVLLCVVAVAILLTLKLTGRIIRPLRDLTEATKKIAMGDFSVKVRPTTNDEVGRLAQSIRDTTEQLQKYIGNLNTLAYRDMMTGVRNKTAYLEAVHKMQERMEKEELQFALMLLDINFLKQINDTYGHDYGDRLIVSGCQLICRVFDHSPVYRFGGDEFVVILENRDFEDREILARQFMLEIEASNKGIGDRAPLSISWGIAVYDPEKDASFNDVFRRADEAMYQAKTRMTGGKRSSRE